MAKNGSRREKSLRKKWLHCNHSHTAVGTVYDDGGREVRCGAYEGAPDGLCFHTFYVCKAGYEHFKMAECRH